MNLVGYSVNSYRYVVTMSDPEGYARELEEIYESSDWSLLDDAISKICKVCSYYGAIQNRLEHIYKNNNNVHENLTAAESQIRDTDMADEMVKHSKASILAQAGESMIAQANQQNQGVLALIA